LRLVRCERAKPAREPVKSWVVDKDPNRFFDHVPHGLLMHRLALKRVERVHGKMRELRRGTQSVPSGELREQG